MSWLRPRTIRGQLTAGFVLLEILFSLLFATLLVRSQMNEIHARGQRRMEYQAHLLQIESSDALLSGEMDRLDEMVRMVHSSPTVESVRITDSHGRTLVSAGPSARPLTPLEHAYLQPSIQPILFRNEEGERESVAALYAGHQLLGYAFVRENAATEREEIHQLIRLSSLLTLIGAIGCVIASAVLARTITRPLRAVMSATRRLIRDPETKEGFPLMVRGHNEAAELANAFNLLVLSMEDQRAGLSDTLALLDSMLAHAPVGFAFFDRKYRYVRVNQFLAEKTGIPVTRYLGRSVNEVFVPEAARVLREQLDRIFATGKAVQDFEFRPGALKDAAIEISEEEAEQRSWLINMYPVKTGQQTVRWVGRCRHGYDGTQALRRGTAAHREAGRRWPPRRFHCPRNQQPAGSRYQSALPPARGSIAERRGAALHGDGAAPGLARFGDYATDTALLSAVHAARDVQHHRAP